MYGKLAPKGELRKYLWILFFAVGIAHSLSAQRLQERSFSAGSDSLYCSERTIITSSFVLQVQGDTLSPDLYRWFPDLKGVWVPGGLSQDAVVHFQALQLDLSKAAYLRPLSDYGIPVLRDPQGNSLEEIPKQRPFNGLNRSGSISRSLSFGNGQNAVLNSNFNLQLSGRLSEGTRIKASIADNSIPIQADGFSQQVREFDQIFIELENDDFGTVRAGDIQLRSEDSRFLNFEKRVTGGLLQTELPTRGGTLDVTASGALARGRFHRNTFMGEEGNQGPYPLSGANGEQFIFIISGSERVFIDGVLLQRGADADYLMNYTTGELTFTSRRPIAREHRINVEFQYTDQAYLRSAVFGDLGFKKGNWEVRSRWFSEQDHPDQPLQLTLNDEERKQLAAAGDQWNALRFSSIRPYSGLPGEFPYRLTDSLGLDSILVYSPADSQSTRYTASFLEVGNGQGNYVLDQRLANGNVYRWVAPINGEPQGNYAPIRRLQAPNQLQVMSQQLHFQDEKYGQWSAEWATSRDDRNRLSERDASDDIGHAFNLLWQKKKQKWEYRTEYQFDQKEFKTVERIRNVEFARDWNLSDQALDLHLGRMSLAYTTDSTKWKADLSALRQGSVYSGFKPSIRFEKKSTRWEMNGNASWLASKDSSGSSSFARERLFLRRKWGRYSMGVISRGEWNTASGVRAQQKGGYSFFENEFFQELGDSVDATYLRLGVFQRSDDSTRSDGPLSRSANAQGVRANARYRTERGGLASADLQFRSFQPSQDGLEGKSSFTSRLRYQEHFLNKGIHWNTFYESGISNQPLRTFSYLEVPNGAGLYTWVDYNGNGLQELNEFERAQLPGEGRFVKIYTPGRSLQEAGRTLVSQTLGIRPLAWVRNRPEKPFWSRWSSQWSYSLENIQVLNGELNSLDPFQRPSADSLSLTRRENNRMSLFYNRTQLRFGGEYSFIHLKNRQIQAYGPEGNEQRTHRLILRSQISEALSGQTRVELEEKGLFTPGFTERNYKLQKQEVELQLSWQFRPEFNLRSQTGFSESTNSSGAESLVSLRQNLNIQYSLSGRSNLNCSLEYRSNDFSGNPLSPVGYEMLQGLASGDNVLWNITWERQLFDFVQLNLRYDGRKTMGNPIIHIGSMQLKALF